MDANLQQLKGVLQMLALPITAQVHLVKNEVGRVERLRILFQDRHCLILARMAEQLTQDQKLALAQLDNTLFCLNPGNKWLVWSEDKLRCNADWQRVRACARAVLVRFNWPLDLPSADLFDDLPVHQCVYSEEQTMMSFCTSDPA